MAHEVKCAIYKAYIGGRKIATTSIKAECNLCQKYFCILVTCLRKLLLLHADETSFANIIKDTSKLSCFQCSDCIQNCHLCGDTHSLLDSNAQLLTYYNCSKNQCYVIGPSKNENTGCMSKLSPQKKKLFQEEP